MIHAFTEQEAKDCFESLKQHMPSLKITRYIKVTSLQPKFLQLNKPGLMNDDYVKVENEIQSSRKLKLEGIKFQVEKSTYHLESYFKSVVTKSHKCVHNNYLLM